MAVIAGHEDLKPVKIVSFTQDGCAMCAVGDEVKKYDLYILPGGGIQGRPHKPKEAPIDQLVPRTPTPIAQRWANTDQGGSVAFRE